MSPNKKTITIIVAVSENNVIGKDNKLIWHLPDDLRRFKRLTSGHSIIMGRKTFESFPGLLPNRKHIVMSKKLNKNFHKDVAVVDSFREAILLSYASWSKELYFSCAFLYSLTAPLFISSILFFLRFFTAFLKRIPPPSAVAAMPPFA